MLPFVILLLVLSFSANADTIGPGCGFEWDYSEADQEGIDGFRFYLDGIQVIELAADLRGVSCADVALTQGAHVAEVSAYNAVDESGRSDPLAFVYVETAPGAPQSLRLVVSFGSQ
jgi:hypothetical protein